MSDSFVRKLLDAKHLSKRHKKILEILERYPESTVIEIAELIYGKKIEQKWLRSSSEYASVNRSLLNLEKRDLVERSGGQIKWRLRKTQ